MKRIHCGIVGHDFIPTAAHGQILVEIIRFREQKQTDKPDQSAPDRRSAETNGSGRGIFVPATSATARRTNTPLPQTPAWPAQIHNAKSAGKTPAWPATPGQTHSKATERSPPVRPRFSGSSNPATHRRTNPGKATTGRNQPNSKQRPKSKAAQPTTDQPVHDGFIHLNLDSMPYRNARA